MFYIVELMMNTNPFICQICIFTDLFDPDFAL